MEEKEKDHLQDASTKHIDGLKIEEYPSSPRLPGKAPLSALNPVSELPAVETSSSESEPSSESSSESGEDNGGNNKAFKVRKWPTPWYWQFLVLLVRTFRQSRHIILSKLNLLQTVILTIVASVIWFQLPNHEDSIADRYGYVSDKLQNINNPSNIMMNHHWNYCLSEYPVSLQLFFTIVYWGAQPLFMSTISCKSTLHPQLLVMDKPWVVVVYLK